MLTHKEFLTVSELNGLIQDVLHMGFPNSLWVCGEIQGYDRNRDKKHIFFELCEKDSISKDVLARVGLVIFSGKRTYLDEILKGAENGFQIKDDIEVKFLCQVDFYPPHGAVRLVVESIDPVYTLGKIAQEKQRLIALLKKNGILDKNKEIVLPQVPLCLGLITAYDSAAYNDFISELKMSGFSFKVLHKNTVMQGRLTEGEVCHAIEEFNQMTELDAIVITRGGGSIADLSCFDSQRIAEKIASSQLPVLSGIGHEINITVTDLASHTYQKTPTAVAAFLVERVANFLTGMEEKRDILLTMAQEKLDHEKNRVKDCALNLQSNTNYFLKAHHQTLSNFLEIVRRQPLRYLKTSGEFHSTLKDSLFKVADSRLKDNRLKVLNFQRLIDVASPINTVKRGFSITRGKQGELIRSVKNVKPGDALQIQLSDGVVQSLVKNIKQEGTRG